MTAMPAQMANRWQHRPEPAPDEGTVYWHVLMRDYPQAVELTRQAQRQLAPFGGLHMTPLEWLHITTMVAGPAADLASDQLDQMARTAAGLLADLPPVTGQARPGAVPPRGDHAGRDARKSARPPSARRPEPPPAR